MKTNRLPSGRNSEQIKHVPDLRRQSERPHSNFRSFMLPRPSVDELRLLFSYDSEEGLLSPLSKRVTRRRLPGYFSWKIDSKYLQEHTIIWAIVTGEYPEFTVDHKDRNGRNNRWANLRPATQAQQQVNRRIFSKSGFRGVYPCRGRWEAQIRFDKKTHSLGVFDTQEEAAAVVQSAREALWGEFARAA